MKIYHNPRCRKSRETLHILLENNIKLEVIEYLKTPLNKQEIKNILKMLGLSAKDIVRKGETIFKDLYKGKDLSRRPGRYHNHMNKSYIDPGHYKKDY